MIDSGGSITACGFAAIDPYNAVTDACHGSVRRISNNNLTEEVTMIYLVDPMTVRSDRRCILNVPLYGIPPEPCYTVCAVLCILRP